MPQLGIDPGNFRLEASNVIDSPTTTVGEEIAGKNFCLNIFNVAEKKEIIFSKKKFKIL